jgi:hypothetical protein
MTCSWYAEDKRRKYKFVPVQGMNTDKGHRGIAPLFLNLLKPTGHVMHQQFNIQQLYVLPTLYLCVLYLSENKQRLVPLTAQTDWFL